MDVEEDREPTEEEIERTLEDVYKNTWYCGITEDGKRFAEQAYSNDTGINIKDLSEKEKEQAYIKLFSYDIFLSLEKQLKFFIYRE